VEIIKKQEKSLGELLLKAGFINNEQLRAALAEQAGEKEPLGKILVRHGYVREEDIINVLKGLLVVVFQAGGEFFGLEVVFAGEILHNKKITPLPAMPPNLLGVVSLREKVVPVFSLNMIVFGEKDKFTDETKVIVIEKKGKTAGVLADKVLSVKNFSSKDLFETSKNSSYEAKPYVAGVIKDAHGIITLLNPDVLLEGGR